MTLIKRNFPVLGNLTDFFDDDWFKGKFSNGDWTPAVNIVDNSSDYEIEISAPGINKEDFNVKVENNVLTVSGKTEKEEEEKKKNYTRKEFSSSSFSRSFTLPDNIDENGIVAKYDKGILKLTLGKTSKELPKSKQVAID